MFRCGWLFCTSGRACWELAWACAVGSATTRVLGEVALGGSGTPVECFRRPEYAPGPPCETPTRTPGQVPAAAGPLARCSTPLYVVCCGRFTDTYSAANMQPLGGRHGNGTGRYCSEGGMKNIEQGMFHSGMGALSNTMACARRGHCARAFDCRRAVPGTAPRASTSKKTIKRRGPTHGSH